MKFLAKISLHAQVGVEANSKEEAKEKLLNNEEPSGRLGFIVIDDVYEIEEQK